jgi:hypothetical protein
MEGDVEASLERLGSKKPAPIELTADDSTKSTVDLTIDRLEAGGYSARVRIGAAPPTRHDFACERAGPAWSDSRPDPERLRRIADATGARSVAPDDIDDLPLPESTRVAAERHVVPVLPSWGWTLCAAAVLGAHWVARRRGGLA